MDSNKSKNNPDKTPYEILGVNEGADFEDIQKARDLKVKEAGEDLLLKACLLYTSPSPRDKRQSRMPSSA